MTETIKMERAERVAFADTTHLGRPRWSELSVFYLHEPTATGKRWLAMSVGMSSLPGEKAITDKVVTFGLESALQLFDDNPIGTNVKVQARDWAAHTFPAEAGHPAARQLDRFAGKNDGEALEWLFPDGTTAKDMATALGLNDSTLREMRKRQVRVPLLTLAPFIDRAAFRKALGVEGDAAHG